MESILGPAAAGDLSLRFDELERLRWLPPRDIPPGYDGLRSVAKVDGSDRISHHVYDPAGAASTIRTDGDGPGLATSLYWFDGICRPGALDLLSAQLPSNFRWSASNDSEAFDDAVATMVPSLYFSQSNDSQFKFRNESRKAETF